MSFRELADRHDLAALLFLRSIQEPWNPESHASFSAPFRESIKTIWMCTRHNGYPQDVARRLCSFLGRDWWPDAMIECWNFSCRNQRAESRALTFYERRKPTRTTMSSTCPKCKIPYYCSNSCRKAAYDDGHKVNCTKLPFAAGKIDEEERQLYVDILGDLPSFLANQEHDVKISGSLMDFEAEAKGSDDDEDESSWETIGSDEDIEMATDSPTMIISRFFAKSRRKRSDVAMLR
jgi:radical SAM protein with 4Fe4S-binding SPASM domain